MDDQKDADDHTNPTMLIEQKKKNNKKNFNGGFFLTGASPRTGSFLFTMISPLRLERSRLMVFHTFSRIGSRLLKLHNMEVSHSRR